MSQRINQILEVIEEVREEFRNRNGLGSVSRMRVKAVAIVANRLGIANQTVLDKFIRQLRPDIDVAADFDRLLENWLINDIAELRKIILNHASDPQDVDLINNAFYKAPEPDIVLAKEFGYDPNDNIFKEGKVQLRLHLTKERNHFLVMRAKQIWNLQQRSNTLCNICSFSFREIYGKIGEGFIEAHHVLPISSINLDTIVNVTDLIPVCSNCHSMLHRYRPWLSFEQLNVIVSEQKSRINFVPKVN